jgi:hypothetical protein
MVDAVNFDILLHFVGFFCMNFVPIIKDFLSKDTIMPFDSSKF